MRYWEGAYWHSRTQKVHHRKREELLLGLAVKNISGRGKIEGKGVQRSSERVHRAGH